MVRDKNICHPVVFQQGLLPKARLYVHLSENHETAVKVGSRHGRAVVYQVAAGKMAEDGYDFYFCKWCMADKIWISEIFKK